MFEYKDFLAGLKAGNWSFLSNHIYQFNLNNKGEFQSLSLKDMGNKSMFA